MILGVSSNTWVLLVVAVMQLITLYYTRKTEKNTNSMKDALVANAYREGRAEMKSESEATAASVAKGVKQERVSP